MDTAQLIISSIAAVGSIASGAMLAWSIYLFRYNLHQQEISSAKAGHHKLQEVLFELHNFDNTKRFKKIFREYFKSEDFAHNVRNIYNGMQVAYKKSPIKDYIETHLVFESQFGTVLFSELDKYFADIESILSSELKKMFILRGLFDWTYNDYLTLKKNVVETLSKDFITNQIYVIYYEQKNELLSYDQFVEKLSIKCTEQTSLIYNKYNEVLSMSLKLFDLVVRELAKLNDKSYLHELKSQISVLHNKDTFNAYKEHFKNNDDLYSSFIKLCSQRDLLVSQLNNKNA